MITPDRKTIIQIFGSLMCRPSLLSDIDKYQLEPNDFPFQLDRFIFSAIYNLYIGGAESIHTIDIDTYLQDNTLAKDLIEKENGIQFLQDCENFSDVNNFSYYYKKLKKINLLRELEKQGKDISQFYCEDSLNPDYIKINSNFEKLTTDEIVNKLKGEIAVLENKYVLNSAIEEDTAFSGVKELIKELQTTPEVGVRLQGDIFNTVSRGGRKGKLYLRSAGSGLGKALPNYTRIPTPNGWKTVGEIKVGDYLFDRFGKPTKVLAVYPQEEKKQVYKIHFKSGKIAECCGEHLWSYYSNLNDKNPNKLLTSTVKELIENPKGLRCNSTYRWSVPICKPVQYEEKNYGIPPYVMGLILGDGSFRYISSQKAFNFSSNDEELVKSIQEIMGYKSYKKNSLKNYNWSFKIDQEKNPSSHENVWVEDILKNYPELWNTKSETKFIPEEYLFGSIEQRYDLLAGLLDTDGSIDKKGRVSYCTINERLKNQVVELCESLGFSVSVAIDKRTEKYVTGTCYTVHIQAKKEDKVKIFKLSRKKELALEYLNNGKREERRDRDSIVEIEKTDNYADMTCFYVDNEEHLFLMNDFICTHNTRSMVGDACNIAYPIRYEPAYGKWISTGMPEKVLYVATEQELSEIKTMILAYLTGYNEELFLYGTFGEEHKERIDKALQIMEMYKDNLMLVKVPDPCSSVIKNLFRKYNFQFGIENFFFDYIFSSPAMLNEYRDLKIREDVALRLFVTTLKNLATELDAFILTATQISNDDDKAGGFRDYRNIRGSRAVVDLVDLACIMSRPTKEELKLVEGFQKSFNFQPDCVIDVFKNRRGRWTQIRIWSKNDLGTCRRYDLFATTANMRPIEDFQIVDFVSEKPKDLVDLEKLFNDGEVSDDIEEKLIETFIPERKENLLDEVTKAFGNQEEKAERLKNTDWSELI